ncbi:MAG: adenylate/guanylate cyclase domain-containing protein [Alphaproteobacteria bacterium]|nr:adenylate/guanylate cyclase domain-containing protein [Alphaproteobacteria bacterium]
MQPSPPDAFQDAVLRSERTRAGALGTLLLVNAVIVFLVLWGAPDEERARFIGDVSPWYGATMLTAAGVYELLWWRRVSRDIERGRRPPAIWPFINASLEVSVPTASILIIANLVGPAAALSAPPSLAYGIFIPMTILLLDPRLCIWAGALATLEYLGLLVYWQEPVVQAFGDSIPGLAVYHAMKGLLILSCGVVSALVAHQLRRRVQDSVALVRERDHIANLFGQHVSPDVARTLIAGAPGQESRQIAMMFLDIRGFTTFSESRSAQEVVDYLNALLGPLLDVVAEHRGMVNKLLGDGFMAVFGAPESDPNAARHGVRAARALLAEVDRLVAEEGLPATRIGIGLHLGDAVTGIVGSGERREYTVIGDTVNLASRVEGMCKQYDAQLLVTESLWDALPEADKEGEALEPAPIRGREEPVRLFKLA